MLKIESWRFVDSFCIQMFRICIQNFDAKIFFHHFSHLFDIASRWSAATTKYTMTVQAGYFTEMFYSLCLLLYEKPWSQLPQHCVGWPLGPSVELRWQRPVWGSKVTHALATSGLSSSTSLSHIFGVSLQLARTVDIMIIQLQLQLQVYSSNCKCC